MSVGAHTEASGPSAAGVTDGGGQEPDPGNAAGRLLGRLSVLPALLVLAWLLAGLPLLLMGWFTPTLMLAVSVPLAVVIVAFGLRWIPGRWRDATPARKPRQAHTSWWAVAGVVAVAVAFGADQVIYHSQFVMVTRDPGSYVQFAAWIAHHGSLPISEDRAAFGGTTKGLSFQSPAFYQVGKTIVPQFMAGLPMVLAAGFWIGGAGAAVLIAPVLGACAVLTFGGLVARLVGARWAPLAALVLALSLPEQFTSRSTYTEPLAQILFLGGLCLVIDSLEADGIGARVIAVAGGLALGLTLLVRIDGASDFLPLIPYCGALLIGRRRQAVPLAGGLLGGALYGVVDGWVLSRPYLATNRSSVEPLALLIAVVTVATLIAVALLRDKRPARTGGNWLPNAVALLAFVVLIGFAIRPDLTTARGPRSTAVADYQAADHLPVDPTRLYYELSLHWVFWYIGVPAVVLGTLAAALLSRRCLRGQAPSWTLPLMVFAWAIITTLYRPAITPDQPWASRRLVPAVLPGLILLAVWASSWLVGRVRQRGLGRAAGGIVAICCAAALLLPAAITTFGLAVRQGGPLGIRLTAHGLAFRRTYQGEIQAVDRLCAAIPPGSSVVFIADSGHSDYAGKRLAEVVRGMCGDPVARMALPGHARFERLELVLRGIERAGRRPVLLASYQSLLTPYGGQIRQVMDLRSTQDENALTTPPMYTRPFVQNIWMSEPAP
jgi:hypothetical protein